MAKETQTENENPVVDEIMTEEEETEVRAQALSEVFPDEKPIENALTSNEPEAEPEETETETDPDPDPDSPDPSDPPDPLAAVLDSLKAINSNLTNMEGRIKQTERRIGGITNEMHAAKMAAEETSKAPTEEQMAEAAKTNADWETLKTDFPAWANAIESKLEAATANLVSKDSLADLQKPATTEKPEETPGNPTSPSVDLKKELETISAVYPDWQQTKKTDEFKSWLENQDINMLNRYNHGQTAADAIIVLKSFHESQLTASPGSPVNAIKAARDKRLEQSVNPKKNHKTIKPKAESDMTEEELRAKAAKEVFG